MPQSYLLEPGESAQDQYKRRLAYSLMQNGMDYSPVGHWTQGAARVAQSLLGAYRLNQMDKEAKTEREDASRILGEALGLGGTNTSSAPPQYAPRGSASGSLTDRIIGAESGGNATATNPRSSATGSGQFINSTWLDMVKRNRPDIAAGKTDQQLLAMRSDPNLSRQMVDAYAAENAVALDKAGFQPTDGATYLAHFAGPAGAKAILGANPATPVAQVLGQNVVAANPFLAKMTAGDLIAWADRKVGGGAPSAPAPQANDLDSPRPVQTTTINPLTGAPIQAGERSNSPFGIDAQTAGIIQKLSTNRQTAPLALKLLEAAMTPQNKVGRFRPSRQGIVDTVTGQIVPGTEQAGSDAEYGTTPQYYQDAEGNVIVSQLSKGGGRKDVELPKGARWLPGVQFQDVGTGVIPLDKRTAQPTGPMIQKDIAGKEAQEEIGKSQGLAQQMLPAAKTALDEAFITINKLRNHQGLDRATGISNWADPRNWAGGTIGADFLEMNKQAQGQSFMVAREALKGAGQVTDFEGAKGEQAIANLTAAQSKEQYLDALDTLERMMRASYENLQRKAGLGPESEAQPQRNLDNIKQKYGLE